VIRAAIERTLDRCLDRRKSEAVFNDPEMRARLDRYEEPDQLFVVLATPVAEVGRDHDYDWAIVEPSSMRSIIQLAGRVMRHREALCSSPNVMLLGTNLKSLESQGTVAYCKPGFERDPDFRLASHQLADILAVDQYAQIDAAPRIAQRASLRPKHNLVDLEHARLAVLMGTATARSQWPVSLWWENSGVHLTSVLQDRQPFRQQQGRYDRYILAPNEDVTDFVFKRVERFGPPITVDSMLQRIVFPTASRIESWVSTDFLPLLVESAEALEMSVEEAALRFGGLELREAEQGWRYHPILGFGRRLA
jgi:CRISPR-associated endonuclease/helicase Cas3